MLTSGRLHHRYVFHCCFVCSFEQSNPPAHPHQIVHGSTVREHEHRAELSQPHLINCKMLIRSSVGVMVLVMASVLSSTHAWLGQCLAGLPLHHVSRCNIASRLSAHLVETIHSLGVEISTLVRTQLLAFAVFTFHILNRTSYIVQLLISIASSYEYSRLLDNIS